MPDGTPFGQRQDKAGVDSGNDRDTGISASDVVVAVNRFGPSAKPGDLASVRDPCAWLDAQVARGPDRARPRPGSAAANPLGHMVVSDPEMA